MSREAREEVALVQSAFETALSNENSYIQGRLKEEFPLMVYPIMEATPTPGDLRDKNDIKSILDIVKDCPFSLQHRTLFSALKVETQGMLLAMGSHIAWLHGGAFQKLPADLLGCLWNESPDVSVSLFAFLETHETFLRGPADADKKQKYKAELLATFGSEAKPETLQALERRLDAWYPGHSPSTPTPPSRAAAADDVGRASSDASGPPSLAPSEGDDDDETRDSRLPPSDAPFRNGETVTNDDDDDDDDSSAPPSLATSSGSDDEEEDRARFEEPPEEAENATRRTNPRAPVERAEGPAAEGPASSSASSSQPPSLASSPDSSRAASPRAARGAPASGSGNSGTRSFFSPSEALNGLFDPGEETRKKKKSAAETKPSSSRDVAKPEKSKPEKNPTNPTNPEAKKEDTFKADPPVPSQATPPQPRRKRFSEKVALARKLARASVAKARRALAAEAEKRSALVADRDAQLAYFRARREARDGGGGEASTSDSPWTRASRARRVREEASGCLGVEKGSGTLNDLCDGVARRARLGLNRLPSRQVKVEVGVFVRGGPVR